MEGMAKGWDGSRHCTAYGHDFISASIVGPGFEDAVPVYVKIARGRKSKGDLLDECGNKKKVLVVESRVGGHPIWLYVTCPDSAFEDEAEMQCLAILAAQAYRNRECAEERSSEGRSRSDGEAARKGPRRSSGRLRP